MRILLSLLALASGLYVSAYQHWEESNYLNNFDQLESKSYSIVNDPNIAPAALLDDCKVTDTSHLEQYHDGATVTLVADGVDPTNPNVETVSAPSAQIQCGFKSTCIVPRGLRLIMSSSLNVYSLIIRGELYWRDADQMEAEQYLCGGVIVAEGEGRFVMNLSKDDTVVKRGWIYIKDNGAHHGHGKTRYFGGVGDHSSGEHGSGGGPIVELTGRKLVRTWSLLARPFHANEMSIKLMHSPVRMGWNIGDRIGVSSTQKTSDGTAHSFTITALSDDGTIHLDSTFTNNGFKRQANFLSPTQAVYSNETRSAALMTAEVVNLSRNIIITGDDFRHVPCGTANVGCECGGSKTKCTVGLHTAQMHTGKMVVKNVRVEKCGQRGIVGKYCLHFHRLSDCPDCEFSGNAIEHSHHRGIIVHGSHRTNVEDNVLWDVRGAGIYVEDGNEMANQIKYNVVICPWPLADGVLRGCTIPGTDNAEADTPLNQAGIYTDTAANDFIGNRVSNSFNGLLLQASGSGKGAAYGQVCTSHLSFGRWEGNTFHGHSRFGLYTLGGSFPLDTDQAIATNGFNTDQANSCKGYTNEGHDRGRPVSILNNVDWHTIFVGHYNAGDMQHRGHVSVSNNNLIYWKETKNFADGCAAHISESYYTDGNMALPDDSTFLIERTTFEGYVALEANHHCNVGVTGHLCMPSYIFHDVKWLNNPAPSWMWLQRGGSGGGGIFSLSPPNAAVVMSAATAEEQAEYEFGKMFPPGYVSVASNHYIYLLSTDWCVSANSIGLGTRYTPNGILCQRPLRVLKLWSTNLHKSTASHLKVEVWLNNALLGTAEQDTRSPDITQNVNFHQIADLGGSKQGYSLPVFTSQESVSYRLSLGDAADSIPGDWVIEFSDPVMGNRFGEEFVNLKIRGRVCENDGVVSSQHSRRFISGAPGQYSWGNHGACVNSNPPPKMNPVDCSAAAGSGNVGTIAATSCTEMCAATCESANSFCHCELGCLCKPGFAGSDCSIDICTNARCGEHGVCSARYLGDSSSLPVINQACVCDKGWHGPLCDKQDAVNLARVPGVSATQSSGGENCWSGWAWKAVDGSTNQYWSGNSITHTCTEDNPWWLLDLGAEQPISYVILWKRMDECCSNNWVDTEVQILDSNQIVVATQTVVGSLPTNHVHFENTLGRYVKVQKNKLSTSLQIAEVQVFAEASCASCGSIPECQIPPPCNVDGSCPASVSYVENGTPCNSKPLGTCLNGQCVQPDTLPPTFEPTLSPFTLAPTMYKMADRVELVISSAVATQSSVCHGGVPSRAIDGNTDGNWYHNSVQHTCNDANAWWKVDLGADYDYVINRVSVYNRNDCCMGSLAGAEVEILDSSGTVVASESLIGVMGVYNINFDSVEGRSVRVRKSNGGMTIAEVKVLGWSLTQSPTRSPSLPPTTAKPTFSPTASLKPTEAPVITPSISPSISNAPTGVLINLALVEGVVASQSTTYNGMGARRAIDGIKTNGSNSVPTTHTECHLPQPWWRAKIGLSKVKMVKVYNRNDCCWDRLSDFTVSVLDANMNIIASENYPGTAPRYESVTIDFSATLPEGEYVEVKLEGTSCLQLTEVEIFGYEIIPPAYNLVSGSAVATQSSVCHGGVPSRAIDGNTDGVYWHNSVQHTCNDANAWWEVDLGADYDYVINQVSIYNRNDCCMGSLAGAEVEILDSSGTVVASEPLIGVMEVYNINFDNVEGRSVRVRKSNGGMTIAEVKVLGWSLTQSPTRSPSLSPTTAKPTVSPSMSLMPTVATLISSSPTGVLINLALVEGVVASQSTTYNGMGARRAIDGVKTNGSNSVPTTHTECHLPQPWWRAKIGLSKVKMVKVYNRNDCCWDRLSDFTVSVLDANMNIIASENYPGTAPRYESVTIDFSATLPEGEYVEVKLEGTSCLQLTEVEIFGYEIIPPAYNLVSGSAVATQSSVCHGGVPSRAIDGNTDGVYWHNSVQHTCNDANAWWKVDLGADYDYVIDQVSIYNRNDCCMGSLAGAEVEILDSSGTVVASESLIGVMGVYNINFDNVEGRSVRVRKSNGGMTIAEVKVLGWAYQGGTLSPLLTNLARRH